MVREGRTVTLVAATLEISRSSLYYRKKPRGSRADRQYDEQIVVACGEKPAYGYRRVAWWLRRKENLAVNRKRILRVMRERGLLVRSRRLRARRKKASPGGQQLHRTVPSQLEGRRSLDRGVSRRAGSARVDRSLDPGVQSRPPSSRRRKSYPARGILEFCSCTKKRGPDRLN